MNEPVKVIYLHQLTNVSVLKLSPHSRVCHTCWPLPGTEPWRTCWWRNAGRRRRASVRSLIGWSAGSGGRGRRPVALWDCLRPWTASPPATTTTMVTTRRCSNSVVNRFKRGTAWAHSHWMNVKAKCVLFICCWANITLKLLRFHLSMMANSCSVLLSVNEAFHDDVDFLLTLLRHFCI